MEKSNTSNKLYWKISGTLLLLLVLLGVGYIAITAYCSQQYLQEANQKLYGDVAKYTVREVQPFKEDGTIDTSAINTLMHSMMTINPSVEVYLLDELGNILTYVVMSKDVKMEKVDLGPIKTFLAAKEKPFIKGDDPRNPGEQKVFSAASYEKDGTTKGYVYVILASAKQKEQTAQLFDSYIQEIGTNMFLLTLLGALIIGLIAIWFLTKNLRSIIDTVRRFKEGDYSARIAEEDKGDFKLLANTYNEMATTIEGNIDQIKAVENLRRELIANVSHDLRTPLAIMRGYVETMLMKEDDLTKEERSRYLNIVLNSSERLSKLISQLFEYSKLEANQITPQKEPFNISDLMQDVFAKYAILAKNKGIEIKLDLPKKLPLVFADLGLVERVIQNLMDNALKFTPQDGAVTIGVKPNNEDIEIRISDTGPGISLEEQSYIFERYHKVKGDGKSKGAGLGLAIAKKILEIHNSTIQVQSQPNEGASFWFELPKYGSPSLAT